MSIHIVSLHDTPDFLGKFPCQHPDEHETFQMEPSYKNPHALREMPQFWQLHTAREILDFLVGGAIDVTWSEGQ